MTGGNRAAVGGELVVGDSKPAQLIGQFAQHPSAWALKASWISQTSTWSGVSPARLSTKGIAHAGANPMISGSRAKTADDTILAKGSTPSSAAFSPDAITIALAPSVNGDELPAVIRVVPDWTGRAANRSAVVSSRMNSSCSSPA
jgi:hypothetical protein